LTLAAGLASTTIAQNINGTILGTVKDSSGAVLPNATITLTNVETNAQVVVKAEANGEFTAPGLPPGLYNVKVEAPGFKQGVTESIRLLANRTARLDIALEPGEITQKVEVQATTAVINSESATIGNILESRVITALPLNGRTLDRLIRISAGVTTDSASNPRVAGSAYWGGIQFNVDGSHLQRFGQWRCGVLLPQWRRRPCLRLTRSASSRSIPTTRRLNSKAQLQ
jgi:hypothetical protein